MHGTPVAGCLVADDHGGGPGGGALAARPLVRDLGRDQNVQGPARPDGDWSVGDVLREDLEPRVDDPFVSEDDFPTDYGLKVQHHQPADGMAPGAQLVVQDIGDDEGLLTGIFTALSIANQAHGTGATTINTSFGGDCPTRPLLFETFLSSHSIVSKVSVLSSVSLGPRGSRCSGFITSNSPSDLNFPRTS